MTNSIPPIVPGCRGIEHVGITVPDLHAAVTFFETVFGFEKIYELGPFSSNDNWMTEQLNVRPDTVMRRLAFLRCANGANLEIFQYEAQDQVTIPPRNSDVGGHHLAFYVDDFEAALVVLRQHGVRILGKRVVRKTGPSGGQTWIYFLTPWGLQCELVSFPNGKAYEADGGPKLWQPDPL